MSVRHLFLLIITLTLFLFSAAPALAAVDLSILPAPDADKKWGYVDAATGKTLIAPQFSHAELFYDGFAIVGLKYPEEANRYVNTQTGEKQFVAPEKYGIIDKSGKEILPPLYKVKRVNTDMGFPYRGVYVPRLFLVEGGEDESMVLSGDKGVIVPPGKYEDFRFTEGGGVFAGGAYYRPDGTKIPPPSGAVIAGSAEKGTGMFRLHRKGDNKDSPREGIMRPDGSVLVPAKYHEVTAVPGTGLWLASKIDGSVKFKLVAALLSGGDAEISEDKDILTIYVYDSSGKVLYSVRSHYTPDVSGENFTYTSRGIEYTVNARTGEAVAEKAKPVRSAGYTVFKEGRRFGIKDDSQAITVPAEYEKLRSLGGGLFTGTKRDGYGFNNHGVIDGRGKEIIPFIYAKIKTTSYPTWSTGGLVCKKYVEYTSNQYWLLDRAGRFITPQAAPYRSDIEFNAAGHAHVYCKGGKEGIIDHTGKEILPCTFDSVFDETPHSGTKEPLYRVERDDLWGLYNGKGKALIPIRYGSIHEPKGDWVRVEDAKRDKSGVVNFRTGQTIPPHYTQVWVYHGFFLAYIHGSDAPDGREAHVTLDTRGRETGRYAWAEWFEEAKVLAVRRDSKRSYALMNTSGKLLTQFKYTNVVKADGPFLWGYLPTGVWWPEIDRVLLDSKGKEYRITR